MKSLEKEQTIAPLQAQLNEYLTLKPRRAVERLLQENDLQECFEIYNLLQENVKSNTSQLRTVLYSKHENLHQCSEMILQIQDFADKVKSIQSNIDELMKTETFEDDCYLSTARIDSNPVEKIEDLMNESKFSQALKECGKYLAKELVFNIEQESELYYVNFLKVEIVQKLQEYLENTPLTSELIQESINALEEFMQISTVDDLFEYIQESEPSPSQEMLGINDESKNLLGLIYENYIEKNEGERNYPLRKEQIVEVIFKFKLLSLKKSTKNNYFHEVKLSKEERIEELYAKVFHYFSDLLKILDQVSKRDEENEKIHESCHEKLYEIFSSNIQKTIEQISEIFITDKSKVPYHEGENIKETENLPTLIFENELYEKLINSEEFIDVINSLERHFVSTLNEKKEREKSEEILVLIKNLWRDFYHQMLDIITEKINPCSYHKFEQPLSPESIEEFTRFTVIPFQKITTQKISTYEKQVNLFFSNFIELLNKSKSSEEKSSIVQYFLEHKRKIEIQSKNEAIKLNSYLKTYEKKTKKYLSKKQLEVKIREIIVLFFFIQCYNNSWKLNFEKESELYELVMIDCKSENDLNLFLIKFSEFADDNFSPSEYQLFYEIIDSYINIEISYRELSTSEQIERWQQEFDKIFGVYSIVLKKNTKLKNNLKQLILALIKTKLTDLEDK